MVASSSCTDYDSCGKASFESSGSIAGCSSSSSSSHKSHRLVGINDNVSKLSCSSSSTDTTSRNSWERSLPVPDNTIIPTNISKPHKAHDGAWAAIQRLKSKGGSLGITHFKLLYRVGHGDIGHVFLAQLRGTRCFFAMKVMDREALTQRKKVQRMHREREILEFVDHPFLPTLYAHFEAEQFSCLVMDYCTGGDLHALRQKYPGRRFAIKAARFYAAEVLLALEYLHMLGIVYRDLKPENVLVRDDGHIMLTDFDLSFKADVQPKLMKCPLSSSSSSSGRFNLLRSFSVSSSMSSTSTRSHIQESSLNCMLPSACAIHPFLSCLPLAANIKCKAEQAQKKHQKHPLAMLFMKQSARMKPKLEGLCDQVSTQMPSVPESDVKHVQKQGAGIDACKGRKNIESLETLESTGIRSKTIKEDVELCNSEEGVGAEAVNALVEDNLAGLELVAEPTQARSMSFVGTHEYLSPEMIAGQGHGNAVDWWTFGIFLFELIYGRTPFKGACNEQTLLNIIKQELKFPEWGHVHAGEHAKSLIEGLLVKDPRERLGSLKGAAEIKQHPFFKGVNWALIRSTQPPEVPKRKTTSSYHHHQQQQHHDEKGNGFTVSRAASKPLPHFDYF